MAGTGTTIMLPSSAQLRSIPGFELLQHTWCGATGCCSTAQSRCSPPWRVAAWWSCWAKWCEKVHV